MAEPKSPHDAEPEGYEPPKVEDLQAGDGTSVTAAGGTVTPGAE